MIWVDDFRASRYKLKASTKYDQGSALTELDGNLDVIVPSDTIKCPLLASGEPMLRELHVFRVYTGSEAWKNDRYTTPHRL